MSTPPNEEGSQDMQTGADAGKKEAPSLNITDAAMMDKLYEKWVLGLKTVSSAPFKISRCVFITG